MLKSAPTYWFLILSLLVVTCGPSEKELQVLAEDEAWSEMMKTHDEVMPKTSEIVAVYTSLKDYASKKTDEKDSVEELQLVIEELENAEEAMFAWMNELKNLKSLRANASHGEIMVYLEQEQTAIDIIKEQMLNALENGEKAMNKYTL